jgi:predicted SAM-dependent methyltransferase
MSQYTDLIFVDMRHLAIDLPGLSFRAGTLTNLPFDSNSVESISSLSVVEHVGLGRYGDPLDARGTDRACKELGRILRPGGALYVAVPTEKQTSTHFNAHRVFTPDDFIAKFPGLYLAEERYATTNGLLDRKQYEEAEMPYAFGCFHFGKSCNGMS